MNHNSINQEQTHFSDAEGLLDFAAIKLSLLLLFLITTFVHKTVSSDSAENRMNDHLKTTLHYYDASITDVICFLVNRI